jgi:hypothetical protein
MSGSANYCPALWGGEISLIITIQPPFFVSFNSPLGMGFSVGTEPLLCTALTFMGIKKLAAKARLILSIIKVG